ncbi:MAG: hypothetical protein EAZ08_02865 [Cytophagales bacterium]|nr:MAG: hypothetical protein EAZ08_02865 [Cytophagales bacterium]
MKKLFEDFNFDALDSPDFKEDSVREVFSNKNKDHERKNNKWKHIKSGVNRSVRFAISNNL